MEKLFNVTGAKSACGIAIRKLAVERSSHQNTTSIYISTSVKSMLQ